MSTEISLDGEKFSGKRVMSVTFDMDELLTQLPGGTKALNEQIDAVIPKHLTYQYDVEDGEAVYKFTLAFESKQDYIDKLKDILSKAPEVKFTYSSGVFTRGVTYSENFESRELFTWFDKLVVDNGLKDTTGGYVRNYSADKFWNQTEVKVNLDGEQYTCKGGKVDIKSGGSSVVSNISISTALKSSGDIERTMLIIVPKSVDKSQITLIDNYLNDTIPDSGQWTKRTRSESIIYTVKFTAGSAAKLQNYMEKLTSRKCECSLENAKDLSQPLAESSVLSESLDFSYFGGESAVAVTYEISSEINEPYQINLDDGTQEKTVETTLDGSKRVCKGSFTSIKFKTILRNTAVVESVEYNLTQIGKDKFIREVLIVMEDGTAPTVLDNLSEYYKVKGAGNTQISVRNDTLPTVVICIGGSSKQITAAEAVLFGGVGARALGYDSDWGFYTLHPDTTLIDSFDITSLITLTNVKVYTYTYLHKNNIMTKVIASSNGQSTSRKIQNKSDAICVGLDNGIQTITIIGYYFNGWAVFFIVLTVLLLIALIAMATLLYLYRLGKITLPTRNREPGAPQSTESVFNYSPITPPSPAPEPAPIPLPIPEPEPEPEPMPAPRDLTESFDDEAAEPPIFFSMPVDTQPEQISQPEPPIAMPQSSEPDMEPVLSYPEKCHSTIEPASAQPVEQPPVFTEPEIIDTPHVEPAVPDKTAEEPIQRDVPKDYTDDDMIEDLDALGLLSEYKRRVQKVKVKVRKVKGDSD
ncbi:MAG: hypothetical protein PUB37_07365 [Firmicutes bacterium]|nr:hypothetical protein [Bacillota bacterium]